MEPGKIYIDTNHITLGQLLKLTNLFDSGGMVKHFLQNVGVKVNNEIEHRRGRKLYHSDVIEVNGQTFIVQKKSEE